MHSSLHWTIRAGATAAALTNPLDVAKTRLQTQSDTGVYYNGMRDVISHIKRTEGWTGFTRGIIPRMIFFSMAAGIQWGTYEYIKYEISPGTLHSLFSSLLTLCLSSLAGISLELSDMRSGLTMSSLSHLITELKAENFVNKDLPAGRAFLMRQPIEIVYK
jgi:hypothetical protein